MDGIVRVMRENITGIRVVKALSREPYEKKRFLQANTETTRRDIRAGMIMALPGPVVTLFLNIGLTLVVLLGAKRVNAGQTEPGVILAFLTYFNMILMGVMGLNRIFMMMSKANASAGRIGAVITTENPLQPIPEDAAAKPGSDDYIIFDHVSFSYAHENTTIENREEAFAGSTRQKCLENVNFAIPRGGSLGIMQFPVNPAGSVIPGSPVTCPLTAEIPVIQEILLVQFCQYHINGFRTPAAG